MRKQFFLFLIALLCLVSSAQAQNNRVWGRNSSGQLGIGTVTYEQPSPLNFTAVTDVTGISGGNYHTLFLRANGTVAVAGYNSKGQLGIGNYTSQSTPVAVPGLTNVIQVSGGGEFSVVLLADGTVRAWGLNQHGQLGIGSFETSGCLCRETPVVTVITDVVQIDSGFRHVLALKADGTVWAWGSNDYGTLGDGTNILRRLPVQVTGLTGIIAVSAGDTHSMALKSDGTVYVWGYNDYGQIGNGSSNQNLFLTPTLNTTLSNVVQISAGAYHNLALLKDGSVRVWGNNWAGQVGNGTAGSIQLTPASPNGIANVIEIDTGGGTTNYVRLRDGSIRAWGASGSGEIGDGTTTTTICYCQPLPQTVSVGANNADIAAGYSNAFSLKPQIAVFAGTNQFLRGDNLRMMFSNIIGAGNVSYTGIDPSVVAGSYILPGGYVIQNNQPAYDITATATYSGDVDVCIEGVNENDQTAFNKLRILHGEGSNWVNRTISRSFSQRLICAKVSSFSPFVVAENLNPTTSVTVGGRVRIGNGRGIGNARVTMTNIDGNTRTVLTNPFGYYRFANVPAVENYVFTVSAKRYTFSQPVQVRNITGETDNVDFVADN